MRDGRAVVEIRQLLRLDVVDVDAAADVRAARSVATGRISLRRKAFAWRAKLSPRERNAARPPESCGELLEQRPVHVVADADAEDVRVARAGCRSARAAARRSLCSVRPSLRITTLSGRSASAYL